MVDMRLRAAIRAINRCLAPVQLLRSQLMFTVMRDFGEDWIEGTRTGALYYRRGYYYYYQYYYLLFKTVLSQWDFSPGKFGLLFHGESQLRQSRATQPTVHAGCFSVSIIHRTLTWTTGSLTFAQT